MGFQGLFLTHNTAYILLNVSISHIQKYKSIKSAYYPIIC